MARDVQTRSEHLFEELCAKHGVDCRRLTALNDRQQPDYELMLAGQVVVVEVKQIEPNESDDRFADALREKGLATQTRDPDAVARRVRNHIDDSRPQFRSYLERAPGAQALLVLLDNANNSYTDPYTIQTALHGWEQVVFQVGRASGEMEAVERGFAPRNNKALRHDRNQHLSALATLHECWNLREPHDRFLALQVYHNPFAAIPFNPAWWHREHVRHNRIEEKTPGNFQNWQCIDDGSAER